MRNPWKRLKYNSIKSHPCCDIACLKKHRYSSSSLNVSNARFLHHHLLHNKCMWLGNSPPVLTHLADFNWRIYHAQEVVVPHSRHPDRRNVRTWELLIYSNYKRRQTHSVTLMQRGGNVTSSVSTFWQWKTKRKGDTFRENTQDNPKISVLCLYEV